MISTILTGLTFIAIVIYNKITADKQEEDHNNVLRIMGEINVELKELKEDLYKEDYYDRHFSPFLGRQEGEFYLKSDMVEFQKVEDANTHRVETLYTTKENYEKHKKEIIKEEKKAKEFIKLTK